MTPSTLTFSKHARYRLQQRGLSTDEVQRMWSFGEFVQCDNATPTQYVAFIPAWEEFALMVLDDGRVITIMPLIWREKSIAEEFKLKAYNLAMGVPNP